MSAPDKAAMPYELYSDTPKRGEEGDNAKKGEESDAGAMAAAFGVRAYVTLAVGAVGCYFAFIDPTYRPKVIEASFHQTNTNSDDLTTEFMYSSIFTLACIGLVGSCDLLFGGVFVGRWFAVHTIVNTMLVYWCAVDAFAVFSFSNVFLASTCETEGVPCSRHAPLCLSLGLHIWHGLAYPLKPIDWIHHIPNWTLTALCIYYQWGPMQGFSLFWALMGIPGMIDYAMLVGVKQGWLASGARPHRGSKRALKGLCSLHCSCVMCMRAHRPCRRLPRACGSDREEDERGPQCVDALAVLLDLRLHPDHLHLRPPRNLCERSATLRAVRQRRARVLEWPVLHVAHRRGTHQVCARQKGGKGAGPSLPAHLLG